MEHHDKGHKVKVDRTLDEARPEDYDALVLPGGVANPDRCASIRRRSPSSRHFFDAQKPVAAICHGPWTAGRGRRGARARVTSWPSLKTDLKNAGAHWVDREVVVDKGLVTSRKPDDLPAFCAKMIEEFAEGPHARARAAE